MSSAIRSLILTAKTHGVELNPERVMHESALSENQEPDANVLCNIATRNNLKAKQISASWQDLKSLDSAYPVIAQLKNKRYVIITGFMVGDHDEYISVLDPGITKTKKLKIRKEKFLKAWSSRIILIRSHYQLKDQDQPFSLRWIFKEFYTQKFLFAQSILISLLLHIFSLIPIIYLMIILDKVILFEGYSTLIVMSVGIVIAYILSGLLGYVKDYISLFFVSKLEAQINRKAIDNLMKHPLEFFASNDKGSLIKKLQNTTTVREFILKRLFGHLLDVSALVVYIPFFLLLSPALFSVVLLFSLLIGLNNIVRTKRQIQLLRNSDGHQTQMSIHLINLLNSIETVKTHSLENTLKDEWEKHAISDTLDKLEEGKKSALSYRISLTLQQLMTVAIIVVGVLMVFEAQLTMGVLIAVYLLAGKTTAPLVKLSSFPVEAERFSLAINSLSDVINHQQENKHIGLLHDIKGAIEFRNINFSYNNRKLLKNLNFKVQPNQLTCIVGPSGSGRYTCLKLAQGLIQTSDGTIFIDDHDIRVFEPEYLRNNIVTVGRQYNFFNGSIRSNILMTCPSATRERLHWAIRMSDLQEDLARLPNGLETEIEADGNNLPHALLPKIALARALLKEPKILLLYDIFSDLPQEGEVNILNNLREISRERTVVFVTNRLVHTVHCDQILVMSERGELIEQGKHKELLATKSWYAQEWSRYLSTEKSPRDNDDLFSQAKSPDQELLTTVKNSKSKPDGEGVKTNEDSSQNTDKTLSALPESNRTESTVAPDLSGKVGPALSIRQTEKEIPGSTHGELLKTSELSYSSEPEEHDSPEQESSLQELSQKKSSKEAPTVERDKGLNDQSSESKLKDQNSKQEIKHQSIDSLKLKELGERLHRNNMQAQEARLKAEKKLAEVKNSGQVPTPPPQEVIEEPLHSKENELDLPKRTTQEETLSSFIEGYLKND